MRLIDADVLKELLLHYVGWLEETSIKSGIDDYTQGIIDGAFEAIKTADKLPAIEERQHGHWIKSFGYCSVRCTACKTTFVYTIGRWNYCPHCGAKMDEA